MAGGAGRDRELERLQSENKRLKLENDQLTQENVAHRQPQETRQPGKPLRGFTYRFGFALDEVESGLQPVSNARFARELKELTEMSPITFKKWKSKEKRQLDERTFMKSVNNVACGSINARCNMVLHCGVRDNGVVVGIEFESMDLVSLKMK